MGSCLQAGLDGEQIECAALDLGRRGEQGEGFVATEADGVAGQGCHVCDERPEAVDGQPVFGSLGLGFALGGWGGLGLGDWGGAPGFAGVPVMVVEQHWSQRLAHVPFEIVGEHAEQDMGAHPRCGPMEHGTQLDIDGLHAAEGAFDAGKALVGPHGIGGAEGFLRQVGAQHVEAVERGFGGDGGLVAQEA